MPGTSTQWRRPCTAGSTNQTKPPVTASTEVGALEFLLLPVLLVAFLVGLAIAKPNVSGWISEAEQDELVSSGQATGGIPAQGAQPAGEVRTVKAY